jgi:hypothetical protein
MRNIFGVLFLLFSILAQNKLCATEQFPDILIYKYDTISIHSNPLEWYFERKGERNVKNWKITSFCTALYRGYVATWKIENDSLFLIRIQINSCSESAQYISLKDEFKSDCVFADWYSGELKGKQGSILFDAGGSNSIFEKETFFEIEEGIISYVKDTNYLAYSEGGIYPGIRFLNDTLKRIIYANIDTTFLDSISDDEICNIAISFNELGAIIEISDILSSELSPKLTSFMLKTAKEALKDLPKLMKVNHEGYYGPIIRLWFHGHCLKHPEDHKYGCEDYRKFWKAKKKVAWSNQKVVIGLLLFGVISTVGLVLISTRMKRRKA